MLFPVGLLALGRAVVCLSAPRTLHHRIGVFPYFTHHLSLDSLRTRLKAACIRCIRFVATKPVHIAAGPCASVNLTSACATVVEDVFSCRNIVSCCTFSSHRDQEFVGCWTCYICAHNASGLCRSLMTPRCPYRNNKKRTAPRRRRARAS